MAPVLQCPDCGTKHPLASVPEAGTFDPAIRKLTGKPLGWTLCHYQGVADGRDELLGYFPGVPRNPR